jgi:hypothetical protein
MPMPQPREEHPGILRGKGNIETLRVAYPQQNEKDPSAKSILSEMKKMLRCAQHDSEGPQDDSEWDEGDPPARGCSVSLFLAT